jgi:hypothetical protein
MDQRLFPELPDGLDLAPLYAGIKAVEGRPGHPPADPRLLVALWLYATVEGGGSAPRPGPAVPGAPGVPVAVRRGVGMNHTTLADFRVAHGAVLEGLLVDSFAALLSTGVASLERVAQDGVRVRAAAGAASFRRRATLRACHRQAKAEVERLRRELEADRAPAGGGGARAPGRGGAGAHGGVAGGGAGSRRAAPPDARDAGDDPGPGAAAAPEPRARATDAEARVMKMADGGFRPAYNVQFAANTGSGAIAGVAVHNRGINMVSWRR